MIIKDYYYKGGSTMVTKTDAYSGYEFQDDKNIETYIRIIGTKQEIDVLAKQFINENTFLLLDEVYIYEVPEKGNSWYQHPCFGTPEEYEETMRKISLKIKEYKLQYKERGSFILN